MAETSWLDGWDELIAAGQSGPLEEFWLARLEEGVEDPAPFLEALRRLRSAGKKTVAATLLELAAEQSAGERAWGPRAAFLREMLRLGIGDETAARAGLEEALRNVWADRPSLKRLLGHFNLKSARKPAEVFEQLQTWLEFDVGGVFLFAGRGPGRISEASPQLGVLRIDLEREKRVPVPIDAARKYLSPLPAGNFLRRRLEERDQLASEVNADPQAAIEAILTSHGAPMTVADIRSALTGLVADETWTSWWTKARKNPRLLATGSGTKIAYRLSSGEEAETELLEEFRSVPLSGKIELARRASGRSRVLISAMTEALIEDAARGGDARLAWDALGVAGRLGADADLVRWAQRELLERVKSRELLVAISDATQREGVLFLIREAEPATWPETYTSWLEQEVNPRLLTLIATTLVGAGESDRVRRFLDQVFLHPQRFPAAFVWACESEDFGGLLEERRTGALLVRLVELAERREMSAFRPRVKDILSPRGLAGRLLQEKLSADQASRLVQILERPGELAEVRAWLRRALPMRFPELRQTPTLDLALPALPATVARLQDELRDLRERQIPETLRAIQVAKEHGDLRENFEYHSARARQEFLSARAGQIQADLARVQVIDPSRIEISRVRVGTTVELESPEGEPSRRVTILGPYEAAPEAGVLSHASEAAQALLERAVGEEVVFDARPWRIASIDPVKLS